MKKIIALSCLILLLTTFLCCSSSDPVRAKSKPEYAGIDPIFGDIIQEYVYLARKRGITFTKSFTMGMKDINSGMIIGLTTFGNDFREIDIDRKFWDESSDLKRKAVVMHELSHLLCERIHDYGEGLLYPSSAVDQIINDLMPLRFYENKPGYYPDGCPISLMHPFIPSQKCLEDHWSEYKVEMLDRCVPW